MTGSTHSARSIVDVEALVVATLQLSRHERRLDDVLADWLALNSGLLSLQRTKNIARTFPGAASATLGHIARLASAGGIDFRWARLAADASSHSSRSRPTARRRGRKAAAPDLLHPAALMLRLRTGIGIGNKADALTFLLGLGAGSATVREIADATRYSAPSLHRTVDELAAATFVQREEDTPARYAVSPSHWATFLGIEPLPGWPYWLRVFSAVIEFDRWAIETRERTVSEYAYLVHARDFLRRYRDVFRRADALPRSMTRELAADKNAIHRIDDIVQQFVAWMREAV